MLKKIYSGYFAEDKMLRHTSQHLLVAIVGYIVFYAIARVEPTTNYVLLFVLFTYLPDLDGITSVFLWQNSNPVAKITADHLKKLEINKALSYATIHHKKLNRLILHNVIGYCLLWILFVISVTGRLNTLSVILASLIAHTTFDWVDDIYQMGHIKNWLWPLGLQ